MWCGLEVEKRDGLEGLAEGQRCSVELPHIISYHIISFIPYYSISYHLSSTVLTTHQDLEFNVNTPRTCQALCRM